MKKRITVDITEPDWLSLQTAAINSNNRVKGLIEMVVSRYAALLRSGETEPPEKPLSKRALRYKASKERRIAQ